MPNELSEHLKETAAALCRALAEQLPRAELIIDGQRYQADPYKPNPVHPNWLGFGGRHYVIETEQGLRLHTNSLWFLGDTDKPGNARFVHVGSCSSSCSCPGYEDESDIERARR